MKLFALLSEEMIEYDCIADGYCPICSGCDAVFISAKSRSSANYIYQKKFHGMEGKYYIQNPSDWVKTRIKCLGETDYPEGIIDFDEAERNGFEFPEFK